MYTELFRTQLYFYFLFSLAYTITALNLLTWEIVDVFLIIYDFKYITTII